MAAINFIKHVGKNGDRKVLVLYRQVPGEDHMCLVIYPEVLNAAWQDTIQRVVESDIGQQAEELADALHRSLFPDGRPILQTLHNERMIKKIRTGDIIMTPRQDSKIRLDELNKMLNEMKLGAEAVKKMAENDASRGMVAPEVKRAAEAQYKAGQQAQQAPLVAPAGGALSDRDIAANMVYQAKQMELNAKQMIAEAARMKKEAQNLNPSVNLSDYSSVAATETVATTAPRKGRPPKSKVATADAVQ